MTDDKDKFGEDRGSLARSDDPVTRARISKGRANAAEEATLFEQWASAEGTPSFFAGSLDRKIIPKRQRHASNSNATEAPRGSVKRRAVNPELAARADIARGSLVGGQWVSVHELLLDDADESPDPYWERLMYPTY